jgi:hypothetical protein
MRKGEGCLFGRGFGRGTKQIDEFLDGTRLIDEYVDRDAVDDERQGQPDVKHERFDGRQGQGMRFDGTAIELDTVQWHLWTTPHTHTSPVEGFGC